MKWSSAGSEGVIRNFNEDEDIKEQTNQEEHSSWLTAIQQNLSRSGDDHLEDDKKKRKETLSKEEHRGKRLLSLHLLMSKDERRRPLQAMRRLYRKRRQETDFIKRWNIIYRFTLCWIIVLFVIFLFEFSLYFLRNLRNNWVTHGSDIYEGNSISKLQIQVATYVFESSAAV
jgi:hypothetical protein